MMWLVRLKALKTALSSERDAAAANQAAVVEGRRRLASLKEEQEKLKVGGEGAFFFLVHPVGAVDEDGPHKLAHLCRPYIF